MSSQGSAAFKSIEREVINIKNRFNELVTVDKGDRVFIVIGLALIVACFISLDLVYDLNLSLVYFFFIGLLETVGFIIGYSLLHKSLRGAWL